MYYKIIRMCLLISAVSLATACSSLDEIGCLSPEETYERMLRAIQEKDRETYFRYILDDERIDTRGRKILAEKIFSEIDILCHKILDKKVVSHDEVVLYIQEAVRKTRKGRSVIILTTSGIRFKKVDGEWKVYSQRRESFHVFTEVTNTNKAKNIHRKN